MIYTTYILVSEGIAGRIRPSLLSALVCTGAAVSLTRAPRCSATCTRAR